MAMTNGGNFVNCIFLILTLQLTYSCRNDNAKFIAGTNSVVNHLENDSIHSLFLKAIEEAGLRGELDANSGTHTVLVPNNDAVRAYMEEQEVTRMGDLSSDEWRRFVNYHRLGDLLLFDNFATGYVMTEAQMNLTDSTKTSLSIFANRNTDSLVLNGNTHIDEEDILVDNGVLHFVDHALHLPTIKTFLTADPNLSPFYNAFFRAEDSLKWDKKLADPKGTMTVFLPDNFAVEEFFDKEEEKSPNDLKNIQRYHLLKEPEPVGELKTGYYPTRAVESYSGQDHNLSLYVRVDTELQAGKASILTPDLRTVNGYIEVLDQVLEPPTLLAAIASDQRLTILHRALEENQELQDLLNNQDKSNPYTVFAPTDDAFKKYLKKRFPEMEESGLDAISAEEITTILESFIINEAVLTTERGTDQELTTINKEHLQLAGDQIIRKGDKEEQEANLEVKDIQTLNGVVHIIDRVLTPKE